MLRRGDPDKIYSAQRAGVFMRLVTAELLDTFDAEHGIARWERKAEEIARPRGSQGYWDEGWSWIAGERGVTNDLSAEGEDDHDYRG
jgi:hypothetical protein